MECSCIEIDSDYGPSCFKESDRTARKQHSCCECGRAILPGEKYRYESGVWDGRPSSFKTCVDCLAVRDTFFCGFEYKAVWDMMWTSIDENGGDISQSKTAGLPVAAREKVCALIEEYWEDRYDEDED